MKIYLLAKTILLLIFIFIHFHSQSQILKDEFRSISPTDGLSDNVVTSIFQDSQGFLWFGTHRGLNKYDAYDFKWYTYIDTVENSISGNYIHCVFEDSENLIWVGTEEKGLN